MQSFLVVARLLPLPLSRLRPILMHATDVGDVDMNPCDASISGLAMTVRQVNDENSDANVSHDPGPHGLASIAGWRQRHASVAAVARKASQALPLTARKAEEV